MNRLPTAVFASPWAIMTEAAAAFNSLLPLHGVSSSTTTKQDIFSLQPNAAGAQAYDATATIDGGVSPDGVGVIRICGLICEADEETCAWFGLVAPSMVRKVIDRQVAQGAKAIYFDIDSPGGCVIGVPELADYVAALPAAGVQTVAGTSALCASAAYWLASSCEVVVATRGAIIGSIGVYSVIEDTSEMAKQHGLTVHLVATSDIKGAGEFGVPVTPKQLEAIKANVLETFALFKGDVKRNRKKISPEAFTAQVWHAEGALARGLIDRVETVTPKPAKEATNG